MMRIWSAAPAWCCGVNSSLPEGITARKCWSGLCAWSALDLV